MTGLACRLCRSVELRSFVDLGETPLANAYLRPQDVASERRYPLHARLCEECLLVQLPELVGPDEIFSDYAYLSSMSPSWVAHARRYSDEVSQRLSLGRDDLVVEIASNDGYLLQHLTGKTRVLGIEPAANVAAAAERVGVPTLVAFFGEEVAHDVVRTHGAPRCVVANNVVAHVPDLNGFLAGIRVLLADGGVASFEFPHLLNLIANVQFDTIYHEHFSYFSLLSFERALQRNGLAAFDLEEVSTHGGSLRVWVAQPGRQEQPRLAVVRQAEVDAGLDRLSTYEVFAARVDACTAGFRSFLAEHADSTIVGYGAAAKGNTFLNTCGVTESDIAYVVDRSPEKQGRLLPGTHLPIRDPGAVFETKPDFLLILPWNLRDEIIEQMQAIRGWGGRFVTAVPQIVVA